MNHSTKLHTRIRTEPSLISRANYLASIKHYLPILLFISLLLLVISGCASTKRLFGISNIEITLKAAENVNIDGAGNPTPLTVRFYELKDIQEFRKADFASLYNNEQATIGQYIVKRDELVLKPGDEHEIERVAKRDTRYIGIVAAYNDVDNAKWRAIISIRKDGTDLVIHLGKTGIWASRY